MTSANRYNVFHVYPNKDYYHQNYFFRKINSEGKLVFRAEYDHLSCNSCKKIDELKALELGVSKEMKFILRGKGDFIYTHDNLPCFSKRLIEILQNEQISGFDFLPFPNTDTYQVALPNLFVKTDPEKAKMQYGKKCMSCGRYHSVVIPPGGDSMKLPENELTFFSSEAWLENGHGRMWHLYTTEKVVRILKGYDLKSLHFSTA